MKTTPCRSCAAPIIWARTTTGKEMPLDAEPSELGNVIIQNGRARVLSGPTPGGRMPHHATCPQGAQWRTRRGTQLPLPEQP